MKIAKSFSHLFLPLVFLFSISEIEGQAGNDNPTGPSGSFNGNVTTGGSYDPYTGNATRTITDMVVAGAVGQYGLSYSRTWNTRTPGWRHSHSWTIEDIIIPPGQTPTYIVNFPDGRREVFSYTASDVNYRAAPGVRDRLQPWDSSTGLCYLVLPDGGKVEFFGTRTLHSDEELIPPNWYEYVFTATAVIDPYGQRTTFTYNPDGSFQITEPAGRWIKVFYTQVSNIWVVDYILASDGRVVDYTYQTQTFAPGIFPHVVLTSVSYYGDASLTSTYTYAAPNVGSANFAPVLSTCHDPMFAGAMKKISYAYATAPPAVYGQILSEKSGTTGQAVSTLTMNGTRTETRADGAQRTFTYANGYLTGWTDFKGVPSAQTYDNAKYVSAITDRRGNTTNFTSNQLTGAVTQVQYPETPPLTPRGTVTYTYGWPGCPDPNNTDPNNPYYLYSVMDEAGNETRFTRDTNKRVTRIDYPDTSFETFSYNSLGQILTHRMKTGGMKTFTYDVANRLESYRNPDNASGNPTARYQYNSLDRVWRVTDVLGTHQNDLNHSTDFEYNARGQVIVTRQPNDPAGGGRKTIINTYNSNGDGTLVSVTDQLGHVTSYTFDDYRRLRSTTTPQRFPGDSTARTTWFSYDGGQLNVDDHTHTDSNVTLLTLPSGNIVKTSYDENYWKSSVTRSAGSGINAATTSYGYDEEGNVTAVLAPDQQPGEIHYGTSIVTEYDERNRPMLLKNALNNSTSLTYDAGGRKKTVTQPNGQVTTYDLYDAMNRLLQQTVTQTPGPNAVTKYTYTYNLTGFQVTMQDPRLVAIGSPEKYTSQYDLMDRNKSLTYPAPTPGGIQRSESFVYDTAGRVQTYTNRAGQVQTFTYDALHRKTGFSWSGGAPNVAYGYDVANRMTSITNTAATITRTHFDDNLLKTETQTPAGGSANTVTYSYIPDGDIETILYPGGKKYRYKYTGRNQIKQVQEDISPFNYQAEYVYDVNGNLSTRKVGNGLAIVSDWSARTPLGSVTHLEDRLIGTTRTFDYKYNSVNDRFWAKRDGGTADTYGYDFAQQLTSSVLGGTSTTLGYDANGNRTSVNGGGTYASNNLNQYSTYNGLSVTYDLNGNLATHNGWTYTHDAQNRLTTVQQGATTVATYWYDGLNRQIRQTVNGTVTYNVWDRWNLIEERGTGNSFLKGYLYGAGEIVKNWTGFGLQRYYYQDGSGSTSHLSDAAGNLLERYSYDGFGKPTFYNASGTQISASAHGIRHLFQGQLWTQETGLNDHRNRTALPTMGVFMQPDPIGFAGDPSNLYRYVGNNAVNLSDPLGLNPPAIQPETAWADPQTVSDTHLPAGGGGWISPLPGSGYGTFSSTGSRDYFGGGRGILFRNSNKVGRSTAQRPGSPTQGAWTNMEGMPIGNSWDVDLTDEALFKVLNRIFKEVSAAQVQEMSISEFVEYIQRLNVPEFYNTKTFGYFGVLKVLHGVFSGHEVNYIGVGMGYAARGWSLEGMTLAVYAWKDWQFAWYGGSLQWDRLPYSGMRGGEMRWADLGWFYYTNGGHL